MTERVIFEDVEHAAPTPDRVHVGACIAITGGLVVITLLIWVAWLAAGPLAAVGAWGWLMNLGPVTSVWSVSMVNSAWFAVSSVMGGAFVATSLALLGMIWWPILISN